MRIYPSEAQLGVTYRKIEGAALVPGRALDRHTGIRREHRHVVPVVGHALERRGTRERRQGNDDD